MLQEYQNLEDREKEEFTKIINLLLLKTFILRFKYDHKEKVTVRNPHYSFIERHSSLIKEYLKLSGFGIIRDANEGVIQLTNKYNSNLKRLDLITTLVMYSLRLIYAEEKEKISLRNEVIATVAYIVEKLKIIGVSEKKPANKVWEDMFSLLKSYNIVDKIDGSWNDPETQILIYPSIQFIITDEKINILSDFIKQNRKNGSGNFENSSQEEFDYQEDLEFSNVIE